MARLYRPHVPLEVRCRVVLRQLGMMPFVEQSLIADYTTMRQLGMLLRTRLTCLAALLGCEVKDLRLDHDPPLALRQQVAVGQNMRLQYVPDANDPDHLRYRPHGPQFEGSHDIKTRVRGDHGQLSDLALIRREKRRKAKPARKTKWPKRKMSPGGGPSYREVWPKRPFPKRRK